MFKLIVVAAVLAVAAAAPGGYTGIHVDHGLGPIHAPHVVSHVDHHLGTHVVHSAPAVAPAHVVHSAHVVHAAPLVHAAPHVVHAAPHVHVAPIVTKTVLPAHGHHAPLFLGHHDVHGHY
ncbi:uncharacterized protein LOC130678202 [Microplitis mediator]|uniref:uncharacterized protein LOC130678202 n=1 Tax=Microplitis mediator TaxID=375433 RepID=UPI002557BE0C|nr:uncharacterized protein LOC130678202 [Microplitis mediator]